MQCFRTLRLLGCLSLALVSASCSIGKGNYFRVGEFTTDTVLPPIGKLASNALAPFAGRTTHSQLETRFENSNLGFFTGEPRIIPLGPHLFWFYQPSDPKEQFSFTTYQHSPYGKDANGNEKWTIVPQSMLFDGASVPRFLWHVKSYGPFDFTKSAIIHDWLFEAHHRVSIYDHALSQNCSLLTTEKRKRLEKGRDELAMYLEVPVATAYEENGSGRRRPTSKGLSCEIAGWIMMECMFREMKSSDAVRDLTRQTIARVATDESPSNITRGNALRGLKKQIEPSLSISRERKHILGLYRFAVDYVADHCLHIWNPKAKRGSPPCQSPHASSLAVLDAMSETLASDPEKWQQLLRLNQADTALSPEILMLLNTDAVPAIKQASAAVKPTSTAVREAAKEIQEVLQLLRISNEVMTANSAPSASTID